MRRESARKDSDGLAYIYASLQQYLGKRGRTPAETCSHEQRIADHAARYRAAIAIGVPDLRRRIDAARAEIRRPRTVDELLVAVCAAARANAEQRAEADGAIPSDVRRAGRDAEAYESYLAHYGQAPDRAVRDTLVARLCALAEIEPPPGWELRCEDRARRDGVLPTG